VLILTRRAGETLLIGDNVEVTVLAVLGGQVRIGIKAPRNIIVDREELAERKRLNPRPAAIGAPVADKRLQKAGQALARSAK
jgi:carbon storage regulator